MFKVETTDSPSHAKENRRGSGNFFGDAVADSVKAGNQDATVAQIGFPKFGIAALAPFVREPGGLVPQAGRFVIGAAFGGDPRRQDPRRKMKIRLSHAQDWHYPSRSVNTNTACLMPIDAVATKRSRFLSLSRAAWRVAETPGTDRNSIQTTAEHARASGCARTRREVWWCGSVGSSAPISRLVSKWIMGSKAGSALPLWFGSLRVPVPFRSVRPSRASPGVGDGDSRPNPEELAGWPPAN